MAVDERILGVADIEPCMRLVAEAGWNQTANDWTTIFEIGEARGLFEAGRLIASAAIVPYGEVGWVCMVLVTPSEQRRGLATHLLQWAGDRLAELGLTSGLDATPAGRHVYRRLGYEDVYPITRMQADRPRALAASERVRPATPDDLDAILALDREAFRLDRSALLTRLIRRQPQIASVIFDGAECLGFVLAREGRHATQIGPLVARDEAIAADLMAAALRNTEGPVFIDVPDRHVRFRSLLEAAGFSPQRPFTRMLMGRSQPFDDSGLVFALTGPEFA